VLLRDILIEPIYTPGPDEPSSWLVHPHEVFHDLDNDQLGVLSEMNDNMAWTPCPVMSHHTSYYFGITILSEYLGAMIVGWSIFRACDAVTS
jgi:hypothetical protein